MPVRPGSGTGNPETVVNDVLIDPRNSKLVLLATDRSGVIASDDSAQTFRTVQSRLRASLCHRDPG